MNNKGFTLIELLATIALLAIIVSISFVSINNAIKQSKINDCKNIVSNIKSATNEYISDNRYNKEFVNGITNYKTSITAEVLINSNKLQGNIIDPFTKEIIEPSSITIDIELNRNYTLKKAVIREPAVLADYDD